MLFNDIPDFHADLLSSAFTATLSTIADPGSADGSRAGTGALCRPHDPPVARVEGL